MRHYIAVIHKDEDSSFGVFFPDLKGVFTAGDTIELAVDQARDVLAFAAESWVEDTGMAFPQPRTIDELRQDPEFLIDSADGILAAIPFDPSPSRIAAE